MVIQIIPDRPSFGAALGAGLGESLSQLPQQFGDLMQQRKDAMKEQQAKKEQLANMSKENAQLKQMGIDLEGVTDPKIRQEIVAQRLKGNIENENQKALLNEIGLGQTATPQSTQMPSGIDIETPPGELPITQKSTTSKAQPKWKTMTDEQLAKLAIRDPKAAKAIKDLRNANKPSAADTPIDPEQLRIIRETRATPGYEDLDEVEKYQALTDAGVSRTNAETESKLTATARATKQSEIDKSYQMQKDYIDKVTNAYQGWSQDIKPRLTGLESLNDQELISPLGNEILNYFGIPIGLTGQSATEAFEKLSQDLLKGLPETFGNRILQVEVENFLKTIPRLTNSVQGRRMIIANMKKFGEVKELVYDQMRKQQAMIEQKKQRYPRDFQQQVVDNLSPQLQKLNNEIHQINSLNPKNIEPNTVPFFNPQGTISWVPNDPETLKKYPNILEDAELNGGKRVW